MDMKYEYLYDISDVCSGVFENVFSIQTFEIIYYWIYQTRQKLLPSKTPAKWTKHPLLQGVFSEALWTCLTH